MAGERIAVLAGPTASGKTALALALAERLGGEVVSADSQQVYRHFDVGTAKPAPAELARVPHHLISVADPLDRMDAARYAEAAARAIADIAARGRVPLVVGGTGLYVRALLYGVMEGPGADEAYRAELRARAEVEGRPALHAELARVDPASAARILPNDLMRIERALEILKLTGRRASELRAEHGFAQVRYPALGLFLNPPREELYRRIDQRTDHMFREGGLLEEVRRLLEQGLGDAPVMQSIGYAQARAVLEGRVPLEQGIAEAAQVTRHYSKRQLTWFKKERWMRPIERPDLDALEAELRAYFGR